MRAIPWLLIAAALAAVALVGYQLALRDRTLPGVHVAGAPVGGLTAAELAQRLTPEAERIARTPVLLRFGDVERRYSTADLGLRYDLPATVEYALDVGRIPHGEGIEALPGAIVQQARAPLGGYTIPAVLRLDESRLDAVVAELAAAVDRPAVSARLAVSPGGELSIAPAQPSRELDRAATRELLREQLLSLGALDGPIALPGRVEPPAQVEADLTEARAIAQRILDRPLTLVGGTDRWTLDRSELARLLVLPEYGVDRPHLSVAGLRGWLPGVAAIWDVAPRAATYGIRGGRLVETAPAVQGRRLNIEATADRLADAAGVQDEVTLVSEPLPAPTVDPAQLRAAQAEVDRLLGTPLVLQFEEKRWPIERTALLGMITFAGDTPDGPKYRPQLDLERLTVYLGNLAPQIERPALNAQPRYLGGRIVLAQPEQEGIELDLVATVDAVLAQAFTDRRIVDVQVRRTQPDFGEEILRGIVIKDRLATGQTSYAGGIPSRTHNVELAASRLNGYLIAPGEEFSFNKALGPATLKAGFKMAYGISGTAGGGVQTVPSEAGGICQVATTLFHAVFRAGLDITERHWHLYWIPRYGTAPSGVTGLDATVDDPWVDFKFVNNTGNWLAIQARLDRGSQILYFDILGVDPGWDVIVGKPVLTDFVAASREPVYQNDPSLPAGQALAVEAAEDGFRAAIPRTVRAKDGRIVSERTFTSVYRPSRNVYLVGTGR